MSDATPTVTEHRKLPLPSPDASSQREDVKRIADSIRLIDDAIEEVEILSLALGS